ncbi:DUF1559 domain-containing protein [Botrimarina mediterranea]|uniref:DUF1559 domain-containing protein n=1 Tax=Botrimarina mediterranea TaxID=2528022 RepID=A0A518KBD1_9BACT|nr:DUF1559 domain-containing protein [Botrimarina mediterranea]QDV75092.1 hypothetical protein Spa11_33020 [Botrimarina mediterranea]QDV79738.1 hypothetical protein K2D_33540 [Planctomycetes bacterium K2D]
MNGATERHPSWGFTIVELLVVIAILAVLVALLLPALQSSRESARSSACKNHLRQIALGLWLHEETHDFLPAGASSAPYRTMGTSWIVELLPYLEESIIYDAYDRRSMHSGEIGLHSRNRRVVEGKLIPPLLCPSSPIPAMSPFHGSLSPLTNPSYVGVAGASSAEGYLEARVSACCLPRVDGDISGGGLLPPGHAVRWREVTDGASRTLLVAEQTDFAYSSTGYPHRIDGAVYMGWTAGTSSPGTPPNYAGVSPAYNVTTVRYPLNTKRYELPGVNDNRGPNNPLLSAHPGIVNAAMLDGSVRALHESLEVIELKNLATRDDGAATRL